MTKGGTHPFSLAAKVAALDVGETIYLPDELPEKGATVNERAVQSLMSRSPALQGRRFTTVRTVAVNTNPIAAVAILAITRTE